MKAESMTVSPETASEWLKKNGANRPKRWWHIRYLVDKMKSGKWIEDNGDTISFDTAGVLIDGQHRLEAVALSGVTVSMLVVTGANPNSFSSKDTGLRRNASDTLAVGKETNPAALAASLRMLAAILQGKLVQMDNEEVKDMLERHPKIRNHLNRACYLGDGLNLLTPSVETACAYLFAQSDPEKAKEFWRGLVTGKNLDTGNPCLTLRNRLLANAASRAKLDKMHTAALTIKAWNAFCNGKQLKVLKFNPCGETPEEFPSVL